MVGESMCLALLRSQTNHCNGKLHSHELHLLLAIIVVVL